VCDRQHGNAINQSDEHDVIRKIVNGKPANIGIWEARQESSSRRELLEMFECSRNFSGESFRHFFVPFAIPRDCFA
jgi:hypothetical protein